MTYRMNFFHRFFLNCTKGILGLSLMTLSVGQARAGEVESAVGEAAATAYAKEQIKFQLAEFLNRNPNLVGSTSATIGTESLRFISKSLAVYGLMTARTDKDRIWSTTHLILTPEPTTALVLIAVQLTDTFLALKAQAQLAEIYSETALVRAKSLELIKQIYTYESNYQFQLLSEFDQIINAILALKSKTEKHSVTRFLLNDGGDEPPPVAEIEQALENHRKLAQLLERLETQTTLIEFLIRPEILSFSDQTVADIQRMNRSFESVRVMNSKLTQTIRYFYSSLQAKTLLEQVQNDLSPYATDLRIYQRCTQLINRVVTSTFWNMAPETVPPSGMIADCRQRFTLMKGPL